MMILLRKWNGKFPSTDLSRSELWLTEQSSSLSSTWILSWLQLTWGLRQSKGYLGEWEIVGDNATYQWRCWTSNNFLSNAYMSNKENFRVERINVDNIVSSLGLTMTERVLKITIGKDPAGMTTEELDTISLTEPTIKKDEIHDGV